MFDLIGSFWKNMEPFVPVTGFGVDLSYCKPSIMQLSLWTVLHIKSKRTQNLLDVTLPKVLFCKADISFLTYKYFSKFHVIILAVLGQAVVR